MAVVSSQDPNLAIDPNNPGSGGTAVPVLGGTPGGFVRSEGLIEWFTLPINCAVLDTEGNPLYGALVEYNDLQGVVVNTTVTKADPQPEILAWGINVKKDGKGIFGPIGIVKVFYENKLVEQIVLFEDEQTDERLVPLDTYKWRLDVETNEELRFDTYSGVLEAVRNDKDIIITWNAPPEGANPTGFELSVSTDQTKLWTSEDERYTVNTPTSRNYIMREREEELYVSVRMLLDTTQQDFNTTIVNIAEYVAYVIPGGTDGVASITPQPANVIGLAGEPVSVSATVTGGADTDTRVTWALDDPATGTLLSMDQSTTVVLLKASGSVTATSVQDGGFQTTIPITVNTVADTDVIVFGKTVNVENIGDGTSVLVYWDAHVEKNISYRVYLHSTNNTIELLKNPVAHTWESRVVITDLQPGQQVYLHVRAEDSVGRRSNNTDVYSITPSKTVSRPVALHRHPLYSQTIIADSQHSIDLANHMLPIPNSGETYVPATLWNEVNFEVTVIGGVMSASMSGTILNIDAPVGGIDGSQSLILVRAHRDGFAPAWAGLCAAIGASTGPTSRCWAGGHQDALPSKLDITLSDFAGNDPETYWESSWVSTFDRYATELELVIEETKTYIKPDAAQNLTPEVLTIKGDDGVSVFVVAQDFTAVKNDIALPILPPGTLQKYEDSNNNWKDLDWSVLTLDLNELRGSKSWKRVLTTVPDLYDVAQSTLPVSWRYAAPSYYKTKWFDAELYPLDARLTSDKVIYRGGLESPSGTATFPSVEFFRAEPQAPPNHKRAVLSWQAYHPTDPSIALSDCRVDAFIRRNGTSDTPITKSGVGEIIVDGLQPNVQYDAWLFDASLNLGSNPDLVDTFITHRELTGVVVTGQALEEGQWEYKYTITQDGSDPWSTWTDHFGTVYNSTTATVIRNEDTAVLSHSVTVNFASQIQTFVINADFKTPSSGFTFQRETTLGHTIAESQFTRPVFRKIGYAGTSTKDLPHNVYSEGTYRVCPVGWLPLGLDGRLEDYVETVFVGPDGIELAETVQLQSPTELAVRVRVTALDGNTPYITGVRIGREQATIPDDSTNTPTEFAQGITAALISDLLLDCIECVPDIIDCEGVSENTPPVFDAVPTFEYDIPSVINRAPYFDIEGNTARDFIVEVPDPNDEQKPNRLPYWSTNKATDPIIVNYVDTTPVVINRSASWNVNGTTDQTIIVNYVQSGSEPVRAPHFFVLPSEELDIETRED